MSDLYIDQLGRVVKLVKASPFPCKQCIYYDSTVNLIPGGRCTQSKFAPVDKQCALGRRWEEVGSE